MHSAVIWTVQANTAEFLHEASSEVFLQYFKEAARRMQHLGDILNITSELKSYPLSLSFVKSQVQKRTVLLGDCFNSIHPVAGSSFNMSVKDMHNLYKFLQNAHKLGLDVGSETQLNNFARGNIKHHAEMNIFTHSLVKLFSNSNPVIKTLRNVGVEALETITPLKTFLMKRASGI